MIGIFIQGLSPCATSLRATRCEITQLPVTRGAWCVKSDAEARRPPQVWFTTMTLTCADTAACDCLSHLGALTTFRSSGSRTSGFHVVLAVLWDTSAPSGIQILLWKVTTKSDAGLTHPLVRTSRVDQKKKRKGGKNTCSVHRTVKRASHR